MKTIKMPEESVYEGSLILVSGSYPYQRAITEASLIPVGDSGVLMERRASALLSKIMDDIGGWGKISAVSGWRSKREQENLFEQSMRENGIKFTEQFVARPGHSEHETGLAIDMGLLKPKIDFIRPNFPYTGICGLFRKKALACGFVERYPKGREGVTGIAHEPWHLRYVGIPHSEIIAEKNFTLEEYHNFLRGYPNGDKRFEYRNGSQAFAVSYKKAVQGTDTILEVEGEITYSVSGNNFDGFILTEWLGGSKEV